MDETVSLKEYKKYVKVMLDSYSNILTKVMFDDLKVRATSEKDDEFAPVTMYLNTLIASLQRKDEEVKEKTNELNNHQKHLEEQIAERTKELTASRRQLYVKVERLEKNRTAMLSMTVDLQKSIASLEKAEERMTQQNIQLKELDRLKSDFINITSHELRTPLSSIKGYVQMLLKQSLGDISEEQKKGLEVVLRNTNHLDELIKDLLDISQIQSGNKIFNPRQTDVRKMVDEAIETLQLSVDLKGIKINTAIEDYLPELIVDKESIKKVIMHLLDNSVKFSPDGSIVNIRAKKDKNDILFAVEDFGQGIPRDKQEKIFDLFYQVDSGMNRKYGGTGLGLSVSRGIILSHSGRIWVDSKAGKGTTSYFTLPYKPIKSTQGV